MIRISQNSLSRHRTLIYGLILPAGLFLFAYSGGFHYLANTGAKFFALYAEAELKKLEASGFVNPQGNEEYVVSLKLRESEAVETEFLRNQNGVVSVEPTDISHWYVIEIAQGTEYAARNIRDLSETGFLVANRGLWFCH